MILPGNVSNNGGAENSGETGEEPHPVSFFVAVGLDHPVAEAAAQNVHSFMRGWEVLSMMANSLVAIICSNTSSRYL